jgi:exopolysaccharide biosynthesis WecB/TagA/CpsF family protein
MKDLGKHNVLGVLIDAVDPDAAAARVIAAAKARHPYAVTALAVHGVMTGVMDRAHGYRLNHFDLVTPDGQPVRWAMNWIHGTRLPERVCGRVLMLRVCRAAAEEGLPIYLYGDRPPVLERLVARLAEHFPALVIAGQEPSKFRQTTPQEKAEIAGRIRESGAAITFVALGCPRQEVFAYEYRDTLSMPILAVGAAFDFLAGVLREPPALAQRAGLEWLYRFAQEPRRLWKRYTVVNASYVGGVVLQMLGLSRPDPLRFQAPVGEMLFG